MFTPKRWRKRREWLKPVVAEAPLCEDEVELIFDEPTYDDLKAFFEEIDYEIEMKEERAENRVENMKSHKANLYGKCI